jgi:hypothetical protein
MSLFFDRAGQPISLERWCELFSPDDDESRRVALDNLDGAAEVSTVWVGLDHSAGHGPPLIFESMIFGLSKYDLCQWRYATEDEALAGHRRIVRALIEGREP